LIILIMFGEEYNKITIIALIHRRIQVLNFITPFIKEGFISCSITCRVFRYKFLPLL
jgi:hypothetical protein